MRYTAFYASPMGKIGLSADEHGALTGLWFVGQKYAPLPEQNDEGGTPPPVLQKAARWLDAYFAGENPPIDFPLAPQGSAFQREVWALLQAIPYGKTVTYGQLAKQLQARRGGAQQKCADHPLPSRSGRPWRTDRLCRRHCAKGAAFADGAGR